MSRRSRPHSRAPRRKPRASRRSTCVLITCLDSEPIRRSAEEELSRLTAAQADLRAEINEHDEFDAPALRAWVHAELGAKLTSLRELDEEIHRLESLMDLVRSLVLMENLSPPVALARARRIQSGEEPWPEVFPEDDDDDAFWEDDGDEDEDEGLPDLNDLPPEEREFARAMYDQIGNAFEKATGFRPPSFEAVDSVLSQERGGVLARAKQAYRQIVSILHPDRTSFTESAERLWHEAQRAYAANDALTLEGILARLNGGSSDSKILLTIGEIKDRIRQAKQQIELLKFQLSGLQRQDSWRFRNQPSRKKSRLRSRLSREFDEQIAYHRHVRDELIAVLNRIAAPASVRDGPKRRRKSRR